MKKFDLIITGTGTREDLLRELKNILTLMEGNQAEIKYEQPCLLCEINEIKL